ncbi:MAG: Gfo/Idh/MocA family oxidoreductase [Actinomycetes bacterium]
MSIRIGVIGTGIMGADHARILHRDVPGAQVTMLADMDTARAQAVANDIPGAIVTDSAQEIITSSDVDAVLIASSDDTHTDYVLGCLDHRKPVLCEKPLAPSSADCLRLVDAEDAIVGDGVPLISVGFMRRFDPGYVELKSLVTSDDLGMPLLVHSTGRGVSAPAGTNELTVTGSAIHDIDIAPWLLDSPIVEAAWFAPRQSPAVSDRQDPQFILLRSANGVLVTVDVFLNAKYGYDVRCEVVGAERTASLTEPHLVVRDSGRTHGHGYAADWRPRFADAYRLQNQAWVRSLRAGTPSPLATATDGLQAALVAEAVIASMHAGGGFAPVRGVKP